MKIWERLLADLGLKRDEEESPTIFELDEESFAELADLASREGRAVEEIHQELVREGLWKRRQEDELMGKWNALSKREKEIIALTCLGYTYPEMVRSMCITRGTIKEHVRNAFKKLEMNSKIQIRSRFVGWDFSGWDQIPPYKGRK